MKHYQKSFAVSDKPLAVGERIGVLLLVVGVYLLYFPISQFTSAQPAFTPITALDTSIPLWPSWVLIYAFIYFLGVLPVCLTFDRQLFGRIALAYISIEIISFVIFILLPVRMTLRPDSVDVTSFVTWGLQLCYFIDKPVNCCPSLHVSIAVLGALCTYKVDRLLGTAAGIMAVLISLSTLLVKQHFTIDVVLGFFVALLMFRLLVMPYPSPNNSGSLQSLGRRWTAGVFCFYCVVIGWFYGAFAAGWVPWR